MITTRPFRFDDGDYAAISATRSAILPGFPLSAEELRQRDATLNRDLPFGRIVAEIGGAPAGYAQHYQSAWSAEPGQFELGLWVHPAHQGHGVGRALWAALWAALAPHAPRALRANVREDWPASLAFAARRGFAEERRIWESRLDLASFDPAPFAGAAERAAAQGLAIQTFAELAAADEGFWARLYAFDQAVAGDTPNDHPVQVPPFEHWRGYFRPEVGFLLEGSFAAIADGQIVGISTLETIDGLADIEVGFTAVRREHRRRGIALALKLRTIAYARAYGATGIRTDNDSRNRGMLSINEALGFVKDPAWVTMLWRAPADG